MPGTDSGHSPSRQLRSQGLSPRKRLGQNFLQDRSFAPRIVAAAHVGPSDTVLEIGAGTGVLTRELAHSAGQVTALELDDSLFALLETYFREVSNVRLWHGNALEFDPCNEIVGPYKLVANIPYYITGPILRRYLETACPASLLLVMVQREVAERAAAKPGRMSILAVSVQYYADIEIVMRVPAGAFLPRPKVDSAVIRLTPHGRSLPREDAGAFFTLVRAGFSSRRKQLANSLSDGLRVDRDTVTNLLRGAGIEETRRPETLAVEEWKQLYAEYRRRREAEEAHASIPTRS